MLKQDDPLYYFYLITLIGILLFLIYQILKLGFELFELYLTNKISDIWTQKRHGPRKKSFFLYNKIIEALFYYNKVYFHTILEPF